MCFTSDIATSGVYDVTVGFKHTGLPRGKTLTHVYNYVVLLASSLFYLQNHCALAIWPINWMNYKYVGIYLPSTYFTVTYLCELYDFFFQLVTDSRQHNRWVEKSCSTQCELCTLSSWPNSREFGNICQYLWNSSQHHYDAHWAAEFNR